MSTHAQTRSDTLRHACPKGWRPQVKASSRQRETAREREKSEARAMRRNFTREALVGEGGVVEWGGGGGKGE